MLDLLTKADEKAPNVEERVLCQHPIQGAKRAYVKPRVIESLLKVYWKNGKVRFADFLTVFCFQAEWIFVNSIFLSGYILLSNPVFVWCLFENGS